MNPAKVAIVNDFAFKRIISWNDNSFHMQPEKKVKAEEPREMSSNHASIKTSQKLKKEKPFRSPDSTQITVGPAEKKLKPSTGSHLLSTIDYRMIYDKEDDGSQESLKVNRSSSMDDNISDIERYTKRKLHAACFYAHNLRKLKIKNEKCPAELLPFVNHKPFFPNYAGQENSAVENLGTSQSDEVTSTSVSADVVKKDNSTDEDETATVNEEMNLKMMIYFNSLCPKVVFDPEGCGDFDCPFFSHEVPDCQHLTKQLLKRSRKVSCEIYDFVWTFPTKLREHFFPAFVEVCVQRSHNQFLQRLISDSSKMGILDGPDFVLKKMDRRGWTNQEAKVFIEQNEAQLLANDDC